MAGLTNTIKVAIVGEAKGIKEAAKEAQKALGEVETKSKTTGQKIAGYAKSAALGAAGIAVAAAGYAIKVGSELQESTDNLDNALKDTGQSIKSFGGTLDPLLKKNEKWGHANAEVNDSLQTLIRAGAKAKDATKDEAIAANLAAARHISLASATKLVAQVTTGHVAILGRYGIATKDAEGKTLSSAAALDQLSKKYGGAADAAGDTFQGKIAAAKAQLTDTAAKIGVKLIPILLKLAQFILNDVIPAIGLIVGWIQNRLIPALIRFGLSVADAYNKYVRPYVASIVGTIQGIVNTVSAVVAFIDDLIHGRWSKLWGDAGRIVGYIVAAIKAWFSGLPSHLLSLVGKVGDAAYKLGKEIAKKVVSGIESLPGKALNLAVGLVGKIPGFATGGVVPGALGAPTLAVVHGGEEVLTPAQRRGGAVTSNVYINLPAGIDPNAVVAAQRRYARRNGLAV